MFKSAIAGATLSANDYNFMNFVAKYGKSYGTVAEYQFRQELFLERDAQIEAWNAADNTHTLGHNIFSDMTKGEAQKRLGYKARSGPKNIQVQSEVNIPASVDWRTKGAVNAVKDQGQCGSCWAFSAVAAIEGAYFLKHNTLKSFSEQQLVDCSTSYGNNGCNGGLMDYAFQYVEQTPLETESNYPYTAANGSCQSSASKGVATVASYVDIQQAAAQLKASVAAAPTSVAIEADTYVFQSYTSGVITSSACGTSLDHGVTAVGYGSDNGTDYFLVRNSWGPSWGVQGYVKIGTNNVCGILQSASRPSE